MPLFTHVPHPHIHRRQARGPATVADQHNTSTWLSRVNASIAVNVTVIVGSMWCAYLFILLTLPAIPGAIAGGALGIVTWTAQTFIQLVLLPIIIVGQNVQAKAADQRAADTYADAEAILHEAMQIQQHLATQDAVLTQTIAHLEQLRAGVERP